MTVLKKHIFRENYYEFINDLENIFKIFIHSLFENFIVFRLTFTDFKNRSPFPRYDHFSGTQISKNKMADFSITADCNLSLTDPLNLFQSPTTILNSFLFTECFLKICFAQWLVLEAFFQRQHFF